MASSSAPVHPYRYLSLFLVLLVGAYLLVFLTGDKHAKPKLGIDLQGGTRVTLTARTPDGSTPTREALIQAQEIIGSRVNGLGVSGSEVVIDGSNLIITVPGQDGSEARNLGQTARLYIRPVVHVIPAQGAQPAKPAAPAAPMPGAPVPGAPGGMPGAPGGLPGMPGMPPLIAPAEPDAPITPPTPGMPAHPASTAPAPAPAPQPRPFPEEPTPAPSDTSTAPAPAEPGAPAPGAPAAPAESGAPAPGAPAPGAPAEPAPGAPAPGAPAPGAPAPGGPAEHGPKAELAQRIADEKALRQSTQPQIQLLALQFQATRCDQQDVLAGNDDPNLPLVTCSQDHKEVYLLEKSIISGDQIKDASSGLNQQQGEYVVDVTFKEKAADTWATFTAANIGTQTAFVLDSQVVSAPAIQEAIPGGRTQITGHFNATTSKDLANVLKYGSLPLSFEASEAQTVSATLGLTSLKAGLIAGGIGLVLVLLYSLIYYRLLGLLVALSLITSGAMVFALLVLLGRYINYTLDLAGVAGIIIGIGTTADSFVVLFERIKDEIREGRSFRSAVPRGWARARKTILSGNAVTLLAAVVLYILAVGQVKGFAFTTGLMTVINVVVVFLVTWPLVYLASKSRTIAKPAFNGLGAVQRIAQERRAASHAGTEQG
ncbi:protein translocase subunit SecD [Mycobacterium sp. CBMA293]|uniref:protein translocase subunit SecD n=1 Tax=unclassified Mycolicibacterium TaxID=2636767 RepID=UPI00132C980C|nr:MULTISPECIES: protein translocase subunit SecD [unclassified Mycolicibacterium]MUL44757.1 protein translocase subunit SecD [Mycolicibacterium sp. CBMA 360]MUL93018.1 protein translocase subunit SecD [Mycolicibacterium sp. CBMA 230]MUL58135.1 protein translocase subunit SecD [Mycolicibacterium sp. CBMA 335]MUL73593.1 protein translocase subunit SecD [Mycolicibacterium sp. CBMA 311]MUM07567.1 protein translocase subunit SecD [Mycolicibacterium sp. CBMA 213]